MIVLGNRILVSKVEEEKVEGAFTTVEVQDSFLYKGKVEQVGCTPMLMAGSSTSIIEPMIKEGAVVLFAKYSPHTQTVKVNDKEMKIIRLEDVLAVYE
jgi:co-chaperonin GroES (HSP10)